MGSRVNYSVFFIGAASLAAGMICFVLDLQLAAAILGALSLAGLLTFTVLSIAKLPRPEESPRQNAIRLEKLKDQIDPEPSHSYKVRD